MLIWEQGTPQSQDTISEMHQKNRCPLSSQHHFDGYFPSNISCASFSKYFFPLYLYSYSEYNFLSPCSTPNLPSPPWPNGYSARLRINWLLRTVVRTPPGTQLNMKTKTEQAN